MDYYGYKCTSCKHEFTKDDEIVVCPDCGSPYHKECYDLWGKCLNESKHKDNYDWNDDEENIREVKKGSSVCKSCGHENVENSLFCSQCSTPIGQDGKNSNTDENEATPNNMENFPFFGQMPPNIANEISKIDPLSGADPEVEFEKGVKGKDLVDIVNVNQYYYISMFKKINVTSKSKFNKAAFLFSGGWWLYRKMYGVGALLIIIYLLTAFTSLYFYPQVAEITNKVLAIAGTGATTQQAFEQLFLLSSTEILIFFLPITMQAINFICMIISGFLANKSYYKACKNKILKVRAEENDDEKVKPILKKIGGVNTSIAFGTAICYLALNIATTIFR